jgi:hypothetical protein
MPSRKFELPPDEVTKNENPACVACANFPKPRLKENWGMKKLRFAKAYGFHSEFGAKQVLDRAAATKLILARSRVKRVTVM